MEILDEIHVETLYQQLIDSWNRQDADAFAALFSTGGGVIGFDGSQMNNRDEICDGLGKIFIDHKTATYVCIIREIRSIGPGVFLLKAVAGMIPPEKQEINPRVNTIQSLIAVEENKTLKIALLQNTPAAFHGREDLAEALTKELQLEAERQQRENSV